MAIIILIVVIVLALLVVGYIISTQRELVHLDELCKNATSQIAVQLNSRWDAITALAKSAAQYASHESETLINTIRERRQGNITTADQINEQQGAISQLLGRLIAIGDQWPSSIVAGFLHFTERAYLELDDAKKASYPDLDEAFKK